jgi:ubiquitin-activating enzyme E1-like protein 2
LEGHNRAEASKNKIQQLNYYVRVDTKGCDALLPVEDNEAAENFYKDYGYLILIGKTRQEIDVASTICSRLKIKLIVADCTGVFSRIFCDYGKEFIVYDSNGEEAQETMI